MWQWIKWRYGWEREGGRIKLSSQYGSTSHFSCKVTQGRGCEVCPLVLAQPWTRLILSRLLQKHKLLFYCRNFAINKNSYLRVWNYGYYVRLTKYILTVSVTYTAIVIIERERERYLTLLVSDLWSGNDSKILFKTEKKLMDWLLGRGPSSLECRHV